MVQAAVIKVVKDSYVKVKPRAGRFTRVLFDRMFELDPSLRTLFVRDIRDQRKRFYKVFSYIVKYSDMPNVLEPDLSDLCLRHENGVVKAADYKVFASSLMYTLAATLGRDFTPYVRYCWCEFSLYIGTLFSEELKLEQEKLAIIASKQKPEVDLPLSQNVVESVEEEAVA